MISEAPPYYIDSDHGRYGDPWQFCMSMYAMRKRVQ
jgi:hypothetical protein